MATVGQKLQAQGRSGISFEQMGAAGDGATDDSAAIRAAIDLAAGRPVFSEKGAGATYYLATPATGSVPFDIDLRGARLLAPTGALNHSKTRASYSAGNYFTAAKGATTWTLPNGVSCQVGDVIRFESNTVRIPWTTYLHGQMGKVLKVSGSTVTMSVPFYEAFQVDRIFVTYPVNYRLRNGTIDLSTAPAVLSGTPYIGVNVAGDIVEFEGVVVLGSQDAGAGVSATGMTVRVRDCQADGFLNIGGVPAGGRLGYGFSVAGDDVLLEGVSGSRCKHVIATAPRNFVTRIFRTVDCSGTSPAENKNDTTTSGNGEALYLQIIDAHANTLDAEHIRPVLDGVNYLIAVRSGRVLIQDPILRARGKKSGLDYAIIVDEAAVERVRIVNPDLQVLGGDTQYLVGFAGSYGFTGSDQPLSVEGLTATSIPTATDLPKGTIVRNKQPASGDPAEWIYTATGWKVRATVS